MNRLPVAYSVVRSESDFTQITKNQSAHTMSNQGVVVQLFLASLTATGGKMSKQRTVFTQKVLERWLKEGRGSGSGAFYKPWITIHDFASTGRCHRIANCHHGRLHHLMSDLEEIVFYLFSWSESVIDIREQFPLLPLDETLAIAEEIGLRHQVDTRSNYPIVATTDFLLKISDKHGEKYLARTVKPAEQLKDKRILEKFEIERRYWAARNIDWGVITDENLPSQLYRNIKLVYGYFPLKALRPLTIQVIHEVIQVLTDIVLKGETALRDITKLVDEQFGFVKGMTMNIVRHLIARRWWKIDMNLPIGMRKPMILQDYSIPDDVSIHYREGGFHHE